MMFFIGLVVGYVVGTCVMIYLSSKVKLPW